MRAAWVQRAGQYRDSESRLACAVLPKPEMSERAAALFANGRFEARMVKITPGMALALLERNGLNRPVREERVAYYCRDMVANAWEVNNQGIALGSDGQLYDGQHRLWAVVHYGRTVPMLVVSGLSKEARATIDHGRSRSVADQLRILDQEQNSTRLVQWFRVIELLHGTLQRQLSVAIARERRETYRDAVDWLVTAAPRKRPYHLPPVIGAFLYARHVIGKKIAPILERYATGEQLGRSAPMLRLREYVAEKPKLGGRNEQRDTALKALHAIRADLSGETLEKLAGDEAHFQFFAARAPGALASAGGANRKQARGVGGGQVGQIESRAQ